MPVHPPYPDLLKESNWKSNMGNAYKYFKSAKSGLSGALRDAEKAYKAVNWNPMDPVEVAKDCLYKAEYDAEKAKALKAFQKVMKGDLTIYFKCVENACDHAMREIKENAVIPKEKGAYVAKIKKASIQFREKDLKVGVAKTIDEYFDTRQKLAEKNLARAAKVLVGYLTKFDKELKKMVKTAAKAPEEDKKLEAFNSFRVEHIRGVALGLPYMKRDKDFAALQPFWKKASTDAYKPKEAKEIAKKSQELASQYRKLDALVKSKGIV
ncbi:Hypothetical protein PBC10988_31260 [Planctomycetales bacterium 10988]|nr:Hypothetical protein PBC10988_31260 [Planctomycetales bacterium 10988]